MAQAGIPHRDRPEPRDQHETAHCAGDITWRVAAELRDVLFDQLEAPGKSGLRIDVRNVTSIDRTGIAVLVGLNHRARVTGRLLVLIDDNGPVSAALRTMHALGDFHVTQAITAGARNQNLPSSKSLRNQTATDTDRFSVAVRPSAPSLLPDAPVGVTGPRPGAAREPGGRPHRSAAVRAREQQVALAELTERLIAEYQASVLPDRVRGTVESCRSALRADGAVSGELFATTEAMARVALDARVRAAQGRRPLRLVSRVLRTTPAEPSLT
jgi:anti-anti-sigma regulatory factor